MTRATAYQVLTRHLTNPALLQHSLAVEATMRTLAVRLGEDIEEWGITGLLHDADYEKAKSHPEKHGSLLFDLEPNSIPSTVEHAIQAHNSEYTHVAPETPMDWGLTCCDELTGIIAEMARKQPIDKLSAENIVEKLQDKNAFKEVKKENIFLCEEKLGIPLVEFVFITLSTMQSISTKP